MAKQTTHTVARAFGAKGGGVEFKTWCGLILPDLARTEPDPHKVTCHTCKNAALAGSTTAWLAAHDLAPHAQQHAAAWALLAEMRAQEEVEKAKEKVESAEANLRSCRRLAATIAKGELP